MSLLFTVAVIVGSTLSVPVVFVAGCVVLTRGMTVADRVRVIRTFGSAFVEVLRARTVPEVRRTPRSRVGDLSTRTRPSRATTEP